jgi:Ecotin
MELKKSIHRLPFGEIPQWSGTKDIRLRGNYHVIIRAVYMEGEPIGDKIEEKKGLTVDISYYYDKKLISFGSKTSWHKRNPPKLSATLQDADYIALLGKSSFEIPSAFSGYGDDGFRYWAAVRDGLHGRDGKYTDESLGNFLKPLDRNENLVIPFIQVECGFPEDGNKPEKRQASASHPDLKVFPPAKAGMERFVIVLPRKERGEEDASRVELIPGKMMETDGVNHYSLTASLQQKNLDGWAYSFYELADERVVPVFHFHKPLPPHR